MKIFILEDDPARMMWFRERLINHDITHADSCAQVDRFQPPYDFIFLDHDLGGRQMDEHEDDGAAFASLIVDKIDIEHTVTVIHSYNGGGAIKIFCIIPRSIIAPFRGSTFMAVVNQFL